MRQVVHCASKTGRGELRSLTSLRGIAAMAVVMQHFSATAQEWCRVTIPSLVPHGYVAVDLFFALSGFIMAYTYRDRFKRDGIMAFRPFLANRAARILPLNTACLLLILLVGAVFEGVFGSAVVHGPANLVRDLPANLLLLQGVGIGSNLNGPSWSISVEFVAYILFPLLLTAVFGARWLLAFVVLASLAVLTALAANTPRLLMAFEGPPASLLRCLGSFVLGMAALRLYRHPRWPAVFSGDATAVALGIAAACFLVAGFDLPAVLLFPLLIMALARNERRVARLMGWAPFYFLGEISFSLYLLHQVFREPELLLLRWVTGAPVGPVAALLFAAVGSLSVVPFAFLAYRTVERPSRGLLRRWLGGSRTGVEGALTAPP